MLFSQDSLQDDLRDYFAALPSTGEDVTIEDFTALQSGWASSVYRFGLRYAEAGQTVRQTLVLKTYSDSSEGKDRALKERHALHNLRVARYPVPGPFTVEIDPAHIGRPFVVMDHIDGQPLMTALESAEAAQGDDLLRQFVGLLTHLHGMGPQVLVPSFKPGSAAMLVNREVHTLRGFVREYPRLAVLSPVVEWLYTQRKTAAGGTPVITHRDYHPWNVIVSPQGMLYVLDWAWQISDPRFDLAWTVTLLQRSGYPTLAGQVLMEYERVMGQAAQFPYFSVLATTHWLMTILRSLYTGEALREGMAAEFRLAMQRPVALARDLIVAETGVKVPESSVLLAE